MAFVLKCCLLVLLLAVQQIVAEFSSSEGWVQVTNFRNDANGPPRNGFKTYEVSENFKTGEEVVHNSSPAIIDVNTCMTFDYYVNVPENYGLKVYAYSPESKERKLVWARYGYSGDMWHKAAVQVFLKKYDMLQFVAATTSGSIAVTEYRYNNTLVECLNYEWNTDFESDDVYWSTKSMPANKAIVGGKDHTSGSSEGRVAYLKKDEIRSNFRVRPKIKCFTFWFNRPAVESQPDSANFEVLIDDVSVWKSDSTYTPSEWFRVMIPINITKKPEVNLTIRTLEGTAADSSGILLDDFELNNFACPRPLECLFTNDICGWTNTAPSKHSQIWSHGLGRVRNPDVFANYPVPLPPAVLYTDFTQFRSSDGLEIKSELIPADTDHCLRMNIYFANISSSDLFTVQEIKQLPNLNLLRDTLWTFDSIRASKSPITGQILQRQFVEIDVPRTDSPQRLAVFARSKNNSTRIAIENFSFLPAKCYPNGVTRPTVTVPTSAPTKLDKNILIIAHELMSNSKSNIEHIIELIKIDDPIRAAAQKVLAQIRETLELISKNLN